MAAYHLQKWNFDETVAQWWVEINNVTVDFFLLLFTKSLHCCSSIEYLAEWYIPNMRTIIFSIFLIELTVSKREYSHRQKTILISCNMAPYLVASGHAALVWAVATSNCSWFPIMYNMLFVISNILAGVASIGISKLRNPLRAHKNIIFASYRINPMPPWVKKSTLIGGAALKISTVLQIGSIII